MIIRPATVADSRVISELSAELGYPVEAERVAARIPPLTMQPDHHLLVAEREGRVVGWVHAFHALRVEAEPWVEIAALVVAAGERGQRIGEALVEAVDEWARTEGVATLRVRSNVKRERAHRFYARLGFTQDKAQRVLSRPLA